MINIGFVGVGAMGMFHARTFGQIAGCRVAAASDPAEPARARFAAQFPDAAVYARDQDLLASPGVDAVVIATPTLYHKTVAIRAMQSGRAVLTEPPLARTVADGRRMIDVADKTSRLLMVAHCRRFDPGWGAFAELFRSGELLGSPVVWRHLQATAMPDLDWVMDRRLAGGPMLEGAINDYDFANLLFGDPEAVLASSVQLTGRSVTDTATAVVRYRSGHQLMVSWCWGVASQHAMDVLGPKGSLQFEAGELQTPELDYRNCGYYLWADPERQEKRLVRFERQNMYAQQAEHFLACVRGDTACAAPAADAIKAVAVGEAILQAAPRGRAKKVTWW